MRKRFRVHDDGMGPPGQLDDADADWLTSVRPGTIQKPSSRR
jgi:hypothetical protein